MIITYALLLIFVAAAASATNQGYHAINNLEVYEMPTGTDADLCPESGVIDNRDECKDAWNYIVSQPDYNPAHWSAANDGSIPSDRFAQLYTGCVDPGCAERPQGCWIHGSGLVQFNPVGDDKRGVTQGSVTSYFAAHKVPVLCKGVGTAQTFYASSSQMTLPDARAYCEDRGHSLAVPKDQSETDEIKAILPGDNVHAWLGLTQDSEMNWIDDKTGSIVVWENWSNREGNDRRGDDAGAAMRWQNGASWGNGQWYDMTNSDGRLKYAVCDATESAATSGTNQVTYECSLNSLHHTYADLKFDWSGPSGLTFELGHTVGDASDGICSAGHTHCQAYQRPAGVIRTSNGECIKWLNCDGRPEDELHEYYQNFQCIEKDLCKEVTCTPISQCHMAGTCNNGVCSDPFAPIGTKCEDGDPLTVNDVCNGSGSCIGTILSAQPSTQPSAEPSTSPTLCPTPEVNTFSADLIDTSNSSVKPNGRIYLDFSYSRAIVSELNITMDTPQYGYSRDIPHDWNEDIGMCWDSVNREFTYNELQKAVDFVVTGNGDVNFAVTADYEYTTQETVVVNGNTYTWGHQNTVEKDIPFKMNLPKTSSITVAFTSNQTDLSGDYTFKTREPTVSFPTLTPTVSPSTSPTVQPTYTPTVSRPTVSPSVSPSYSPTTEQPSVSPTNDPSNSPSAQPSTQPSLEPSFGPSVSPSEVPSVSPSENPSKSPSKTPSVQPSTAPSSSPTTSEPTRNPSPDPTTSMPSSKPSWSPSVSPSSQEPTMSPSTEEPTTSPSSTPSVSPSHQPSLSPTTDLPSTQPSYSPSSTPTVTPTVLPTFTAPSSTPSLTPSVNFPTQFPSDMPSKSPSSLPTATPSYMPTTMKPSTSPLPSSDIVTTVIPYIAVETRRPGENPLIEIQYTTIIKAPWVLINPVATGKAITGGTVFQVMRQGPCTQFSELPIFLQDSSLLCQEWNLQFEGDRHCNKDARQVNIAYTAAEPNGRQDTLSMSWDIDLGSSAAFECAIDLGTFEIALQIEGASGGNKNFDTPGIAYIDDWYYLRVGASSGAPVTSVAIDNLDIKSASGSYLCRNCQTVPELQLGVSDYSPDNFVVHMMLDSSLFKGHLTATLDFTFSVEMSPKANSNRRRLQETTQTVDQKLTLALQPSSGPSSQTSPPTRANPYTANAPSKMPVIASSSSTKMPVETSASPTKMPESKIPEVTTNLDPVSEEKSNPLWVFIVIGVVGLSVILSGAAYFYFTKNGGGKGNEWKLDDMTKSIPVSPTARSPVE